MLVVGISTTTLITGRDSDTLSTKPRSAPIEADGCGFRHSTILKNSCGKVGFGWGANCRAILQLLTSATCYAVLKGRVGQKFIHIHFDNRMTACSRHQEPFGVQYFW